MPEVRTKNLPTAFSVSLILRTGQGEGGKVTSDYRSNSSKWVGVRVTCFVLGP